MSVYESEHLSETETGDLVDGLLDDGHRRRVEQHLAHCLRCTREVEETRALLGWSRAERDAVMAPPGLWPLVAADTVHRAAMRRRVLRDVRGIAIVAALVLVAATALATWKIARWTTRQDASAPATVDAVPAAPARRATTIGPGQHARHAGHPTRGVRPEGLPPKPPRAPEPPRP